MIDVEPYVPLVKAAAYQLWKRRPFLEREDLEGDGFVGLMRAAQSYDASKGASFKTYAWFRIVGAIRDGIRQQQATTGYHRKRGRVARLVDLDEVISDHTEDTFGDFLADPRVDIEGDLLAKEKHAALDTAPLSTRERVVLKASLGGMALPALGEYYGICESRASQLRASAIRKVQAQLRRVA